MPGLLEHLLPLHVRRAEDLADELAHLVARRAGLARRPARLLVVLPATGEHLGAADQQARIDPERIADDAEHHDGADAEPAPTDREAAATTAAVTAAILDVVALRQIVVAHLVLLTPAAVSPSTGAKSKTSCC